MKRLLFVIILLLLDVCSLLGQALELSPFICDNAVFQCDTLVPICGTAPAGAKVVLKFDGHKYRTHAGDDGKWMVYLPPVNASFEEKSLCVRCGQEKKLVDGILFGELWLACGQSNMGFKVAGMSKEDREILYSDAEYDGLRLYKVGSIVGGGKVLAKKDITWTKARGDQIREFSAVAYIFSREIHKKLQTPVGIIQCAHGGSTAEAWISKKYFSTHQDATDAVGKLYSGIDSLFKNPSTLNEKMLKPFVGFPVRGIIWYQGESNAYFPEKYKCVFRALIDDFRTEWNNPQLPFIFAQLPAYMMPGDKTGVKWSLLRQAQYEVFSSIPYSEIVITSDCGEENNIHPKNKIPVGTRFASAAEYLVYNCGGHTAIRLPEYAYRSENRLIIPLDGVSGSLLQRGGKSYVEVCDDNSIWTEASVSFENGYLIVSSDCSNPISVRYSWGNFNRLSLYDEQGFPLSPFLLDVH